MTVRQLPTQSQLERRLTALKGALAESWLGPDGMEQVALRLGDVFPGTVGFVYLRETDGRLGPIALALGQRPVRSWAAVPVPNVRRRMNALLGYPLHGGYRWAGEFVNSTTTFAGRQTDFDAYQRLLADMGLRHHLRAAIYNEGRMRGWYGVFGSRGDPEFTQAEQQVMRRAIGEIIDAIRVGDIVRRDSVDSGAFEAILNLVTTPVWLLTSGGTVAFANEVARQLGGEARSAAQAAAARLNGDPRYSVSRASIGGEPLAVVCGRGHFPPLLPRSLVTVADAVARGLSDKEVSQELGIPVGTVRTYVHRVYRRLGVHNRVELARAWLSAR